MHPDDQSIMNETTPLHPSVCGRCAARGRTCCQVTPGDEEYCFPLSQSEMRAIIQAGQGGEEFFRLVPNTPDFVRQLAHLLPGFDVQSAFPPQGSHWRLATTDTGRCVFLGAAGCVLGRGQRPRYCRLFPLWPHAGRLTWFTAGECLASEENASLAAMLRAMDTDRDEVRTLFADMCAGLGLERHPKVKR